jgi:hypothetical protein
VLVASSQDPGGIVADSTNVFWAFGSDTNSGGIKRANIDGTGQSTLTGGQTAPYYLAQDSTTLYWSNRGSVTEVVACPKAACSPYLIGSSPGPYMVTVDSTSVYWADTAGIYKGAKTGGSYNGLWSGSGFGIAVDATNIYWDYGGGTVAKMGLDGGAATTLVSNANTPSGLALNSSSVYWSNVTATTAAVGTVGTNGTGENATLTPAGTQSFFVVTDGTNIYWTDTGGGTAGAGTVMRAKPDGSAVLTLASGQYNPTFLAVDANNPYVYWSNNRNNMGTEDVRYTTK